jgi:hypothetical protein
MGRLTSLFTDDMSMSAESYALRPPHAAFTPSVSFYLPRLDRYLSGQYGSLISLAKNQKNLRPEKQQDSTDYA